MQLIRKDEREREQRTLIFGHQIGVSKYNQRGKRVLHYPASIIREMQFLEKKIYKINSGY
jgi:hypothetical protein